MSEGPPCVYCGRRPAVPEWKPFCSERCKMADLGRWFAGDYRVAGADVPDGAGSDAGDDEQTSDRD